MKLSRKFLEEYVDIDPSLTITDIANDMTNVGNEYDSAMPLINATKLVIGEVISCQNHPDSDHLHLCKVNIGSEILDIICGAPNVREGLKVITALDGATLPGGTIKKSTIRGYTSNGMLCSLSELGLDHKFLKEEDIEGICELDNNAPIGEDPIKYLGLDDEVIDFELTSNRGDLLSVLGMAYEVGAIYNKKVKEVDLSYNKIDKQLDFNLEIKTENCPLFLVKKVENVVIEESPSFIKNRLIASGIRPINNVVDISNYVMLELGQPLHFYDADKLGNKITVRMATEGEHLTTLDGQDRILSNSDIVITDGTKPVGLAGVMGGFDTEVTKDTKNIIIESALFNSTSIRKTANKVLRSEASNRFEKGIDPNRTYMAMDRACHLLEKYAKGNILSEIVSYKNIDVYDKEIEISLEKINKILGINISLEEVKDIFTRLGFTINKDKILKVIVPSRRTDINISVDLIEEVGRIYGMDKIESIPLTMPLKEAHYDKTERIIRDKMISLGLNETLSYALIREDAVTKYTNGDFQHINVDMPMSEDRKTLRYTLLYSLEQIYRYNKARNNKDISIFEIGKCFYKENNEYKEDKKLACLMTGKYYLGLNNKEIDFYTIKGILFTLLDYLGYQGRYSIVKDNLPKEFHPGQSAKIILQGECIGYIGKIHPNIIKDDIYVFEINLTKLSKYKVSRLTYKEYSKYPSIKKDIAFIVDKNITNESIIKVIKNKGGKLLTNITLFDVYDMSDKKSLAYTLTFSSSERTLTVEEVMELFEKIMNEVKEKCKAIVRDN